MNRVPEKFRRKSKFERSYKPRVVAIGPYHFGKDFENDQVNKLKPVMAGLFCHVQCAGQVDAKFFDGFAEQIKGVRDQYDEESTRHINEKEFARMMFLDGCFIIVFISFFITSGLEELGLTKDIIVSVQHDIFLLENQLPFEVLQALCRAEGFNIYELLRILDLYFRYCTIGYDQHFQQEIGYKEIRIAQPLHLLDLLRITWLGKDKGRGKVKAKFSEIVKQKCHTHMEGFCTPCSSSCFSLLRKVSQLFMKSHRSGFPLLMKTRHLFMKGRVVRNIKELVTTGIYVRPNKSNLLSDIHFSNIVTGRLTLPRIIIDGSTRAIFLNMIAHEKCMNDDFRFTSYISFLDSLIDNADDVSLMRSAGVLKHFLNSDEEVAKLFNEIGADLVPQSDIYMPVKIKIYNYLESKGRAKVATWLAEVSRDHFRSPWTTIAVFAAFFAIALTVDAPDKGEHVDVRKEFGQKGRVRLTTSNTKAGPSQASPSCVHDPNPFAPFVYELESEHAKLCEQVNSFVHRILELKASSDMGGMELVLGKEGLLLFALLDLV
ncbi:hypothetical protein F0562_015505 [Nyssa sinensis]|uniref:Uncharacterized protein n=1 Tax=Nyssa sinensis TaxID=561372 RepID=A0A5J4ZLS5_9ASTE|nr:hypothetical protein F0562_015505 [Nyssa sinensis]